MKSYRALMGMTACAALAAAAYAQPANDDPSAAVDLSASSFPTQTDPVEIFGAVSAPEIAMCVGANSTVWYKLVANSAGTITAKTCAADAPACTTGDTVLAIYESADGSSDTLTQLVCNDDFCGLRSQVSAACTAGTTYYIQAAKYGTTTPTAGTMMQINVTAPNLSEPPMGSGTATPNSVNNCGGAAVLFEVTTIPGTNPVSTGITVTGDLFGIGGLSNQTFYDNGTHGDVSSGDGVFSFSQSVEAGTFAAAYNLPFEVRDSIGRFTNGSIALTVVECPPPPPANDDCSQATDLSAATFPTLTDDADIGGAAPAPEAAYSCGFGNGYTVWYKVTANSTGTMTASTRAADAPGCTVNDTVLAIYESADGTCDTLTSIGCNDDSPYPKSWVQVPVTGGMTYYVQAARYGSTVTPPAPGTFMEVLITAPNTSEPPTGTGTVTPATFNNCDANNATLEVTVTPGTNPASNPANVVADLLSVGGSGSQALYDDGTHGDASAGDNVFTYTFTVAAGTSPAAYTFPFTVNDQANRPTNGTSSALTVTPCPPPPSSNDFCEDAVDISNESFPFATDPVFISGNQASPEQPMCGFNPSGTVWYKMQAGVTGQATINTCTANAPACNIADTVLAVYESADGSCDTLTLLSCNDDTCGLRSEVTANMTAGTWYFIQAAKYNGPATPGADTMQIWVDAPAPPPPGTWFEDGEAGDLPEVANVPSGTDPFNEIRGILDSADADMYRISICDPGNFSASTVGGTTGDTQLFLFNTDGTGVVMDDDDPDTGVLQSHISSAFITSAGEYYLAVSQYNRDPNDANGDLIWANTPFGVERAPDGVAPGNPIGGWNGATTGPTPYRIFLTGTCFPGGGSTCPVCPADFNQDGGVDGADVESFFTAWEAGDACGDTNQDGGVDGGDVETFFTLWEAGDPSCGG